MKKLLTFTAVFSLLLGSFAMATDTRVETMGMGDLYNESGYYNAVNSVVKDDADVWLYPSTINNYPNLFMGEIGRGYYDYYDKENGYDNRLNKVGAHFKFAEDSESPMVFGAYFSTDPYMHSIAPILDAHHRITLMFGTTMAEMPVGISVGYYGASDKNEDSTQSHNDDEAISRFDFNLGVTAMQGKLDLAIGMAMTSWTDKDWRSYNYYNYVLGETVYDTLGLVDDSKANGNLDFSFRARYWMDPMGRCTLIPHAAFNFSKQGGDFYDYHAPVYDTPSGLWEEVVAGRGWVKEYEDTWKKSNIELGLGMNFDAGNEILVATDFGINIMSTDDERKYTDTLYQGSSWYNNDYRYQDKYNALPYFRLGIDAPVFKWLDLRCGVAAFWVSYTGEDDDYNEYEEKDVESWVETVTFLGAGFHWGRLTLDASIDPDFLTRGPYFVTGARSSNDEYYDYNENDLATRISLLYNFE